MPSVRPWTPSELSMRSLPVTSVALWVFPGSATFYLTRFCRPSPIERFLVIWLACKVREGQRTTWAVSLQRVPYCFVFLGSGKAPQLTTGQPGSIRKFGSSTHFLTAA